MEVAGSLELADEQRLIFSVKLRDNRQQKFLLSVVNIRVSIH